MLLRVFNAKVFLATLHACFRRYVQQQCRTSSTGSTLRKRSTLKMVLLLAAQRCGGPFLLWWLRHGICRPVTSQSCTRYYVQYMPPVEAKPNALLQVANRWHRVPQ